MSDLITQTARLVPYAKRPKQANGFVSAYIYEPLPDDPGAKLGSFYVVLEVLVSGRASEEVADLIIETVGEHYYNKPVIDGQSLADRFEGSIKAANIELGEHVNRGNAAWIGKLSAVIAIQSGSDLHVAHTGSAEAFLYRGHSSTRITEHTGNRPATPTKTFGSIATGQLEAGDHILLATPALVHQVPLPKLQSLISGSSPNTAISEITELLQGASTERIGSLIIEVTTPELAALRVRSEAPSEIHLGIPETPLDTAKVAAAPIARSTARSGKKAATAAIAAISKAKPHLRRTSLALVDRVRKLLSTTQGRRITAAVLTAVLVAGFLLFWSEHQSQRQAQLLKQYNSAYASLVQARQLISEGNKPGASAAAESAQHQLQGVSSNERSFDKFLSRQHLATGEPTTIAAFKQQLSNFLNQLSNLYDAQVTTVASLATSSKPAHFEISNGKAYIFDQSNAGGIAIVNLKSGTVSRSTASTTQLGVVKYTTLTSDNSGIVILTDQPGVWIYRFTTDSLAKLETAYGKWPDSTAIATYLSNLYILSGDSVLKYSKTAAGYSPPTKSLAAIAQSDLTAMAVDGSIYLSSGNKLSRYIAGRLAATADLPGALGSLSNLRSTNHGSTLVGVSSGAGRMALWSAGETNIKFDQQVALVGVSKLYDVTYDPSTDQYFATADHRLVSFRLPAGK